MRKWVDRLTILVGINVEAKRKRKTEAEQGAEGFIQVACQQTWLRLLLRSRATHQRRQGSIERRKWVFLPHLGTQGAGISERCGYLLVLVTPLWHAWAGLGHRAPGATNPLLQRPDVIGMKQTGG
jgi:hypothetical protein